MQQQMNKKKYSKLFPRFEKLEYSHGDILRESLLS